MIDLSLRETAHREPTKWFELHINNLPINIFYPSSQMIDLHQGKLMAYGIDIECDEQRMLYNDLVAYMDTYDRQIFGGPFKHRTMMELRFAMTAVHSRLIEMIARLPTS